MKRVTNLYKNAYSGISPASWWLSLVMLVNRSGTMVVPFMTLYLTQTLNYSIGQAGLVMGVFGMGAVCGGFLGGKLTDKFGFYNIQLGALICGGIMFLVLGQMASFPAICICTFVLAVLNDSFRPANATAIAEYSTEENRTRSYSVNRLAINVGWALGGALGGIIASKNYHLIFWVDGFTNIGAAILLRAVLSPKRNSQTPAKKEKPVIKTRSAYQDKMYLVFILLTVLFGCTFFQLFSTLPVFYNQGLHLTPMFIGFIMAINGVLVAAFEMAIVFTLERRNKNLTYIITGTLLCGLSFVTFNLFAGMQWVAVLAVLVVTAGEILSMPFMNTFWVSRTNADNRGQYAGLYTAAWSIAQVVGPAVGAQIAQHLGFDTLWWTVGCVSVITAIGFRLVQIRMKPIIA
ncbi:MAG: major facilitator superfamily 1 [Flavipsychrobacter sp.]|nr:major facilitator superfamily 1 [Flavipsychrobacter sp.]